MGNAWFEHRANAKRRNVRDCPAYQKRQHGSSENRYDRPAPSFAIRVDAEPEICVCRKKNLP